jgi:transcriptional regulator with XRE-family HTH domain
MKARTFLERRLELALSQADVARLAGCSQAFVSQRERGRLPVRRWTKGWRGLLRAMQIGEADLIRLIRASAAETALRAGPEQFRRDYPLFAAGGEEGSVFRVQSSGETAKSSGGTPAGRETRTA